MFLYVLTCMKAADTDIMSFGSDEPSWQIKKKKLLLMV